MSDALFKSRISIETHKNNMSFKNLTEAEKHKEIINMFLSYKKSPSVSSVFTSHSRKRMNAALEGYFGNLKSRSKFLFNFFLDQMNKTMTNEELFNSGFELDKKSRKTTYTHQDMYDHNTLSNRNIGNDYGKFHGVNIAQRKHGPINPSERDDMSSNFNIQLMNMNQNEDFNNISGVLNDVNTSLMSYHHNKRNNEKIVIDKDDDAYEINKPSSGRNKLSNIQLDFSKGENMRSFEFLNNSNVKSSQPNLEIVSMHDYTNSSKIHITLSPEKKEETKPEKFFFSFDKETPFDINRTKSNKRKTASFRDLSTEVQTEHKNKSEENIGSPIFTVKKRIESKGLKKQINLLEEILNCQNEFQTNEDIEINHTSFNNNNNPYVRSFPFSNPNAYNSFIVSNFDNDKNFNYHNNIDKSMTAFSKTSDMPFLENQKPKDPYKLKDSKKMRDIIQSFCDDDEKALQIEDIKEYSDGPCDTCAKQCLIF
jgi:hypothetical protein